MCGVMVGCDGDSGYVGDGGYDGIVCVGGGAMMWLDLQIPSFRAR